MQNMALGVVDNQMSMEDALDKIEFQFENSEPMVKRNNYCAVYMQSAFGIGEDRVEDAEMLISDSSNPVAMSNYEFFMDRLATFFYNYFGLQFDAESDYITLATLFNFYNLFITDITNTIAQAIVGSEIIKAQTGEVVQQLAAAVATESLDISIVEDENDMDQNDTQFDKEVAAILMDESLDFDTLTTWLVAADPGNVAYQILYTMNEFGDLTYHEKVFKFRILKDLKQLDLQLDIMTKIHRYRELANAGKSAL